MPPCGTEVRRFVGVDGGDEVEALGPLVRQGGGMSVGGEELLADADVGS